MLFRRVLPRRTSNSGKEREGPTYWNGSFLCRSVTLSFTISGSTPKRVTRSRGARGLENFPKKISTFVEFTILNQGFAENIQNQESMLRERGARDLIDPFDMELYGEGHP